MNVSESDRVTAVARVATSRKAKPAAEGIDNGQTEADFDEDLDDGTESEPEPSSGLANDSIE
jgi:hypothetical protein